jgi:hypothetical protein
MRTLPGFLLLSLIFCAGCVGTTNFNSLLTSQSIGWGNFAFTNNAGDSLGKVFYGNLHDATTNDIQFVLILPETHELGISGRAWGNTSYRCCDLTIRSTGHQWKIEAYRVSQIGPRSLRITDVTDRTARDVDLSVSRFWQVSEDGMLTPLGSVDDTIARTISDITKQQRDLLQHNVNVLQETIARHHALNSN